MYIFTNFKVGVHIYLHNVQGICIKLIIMTRSMDTSSYNSIVKIQIYVFISGIDSLIIIGGGGGYSYFCKTPKKYFSFLLKTYLIF